MRRNTFVLFCIVTLAVLATGQTALADSAPTIIGGSNLLTSSSATQLQTWLGQGPIQLTNIFSHTAGDGKTSYTFHGTADGQGATFDIFSVTFTDPTTGSQSSAIIGGYDPQSWNSVSNYNVTPSDADRTGFIFNLTAGVLQSQNLSTCAGVNCGYYGQFQTYNNSPYGPSFGGGFDIYSNTNLDTGGLYNASYGGTSYGTDIVGNPNSHGGYDRFTINALEVFTIQPGTVATPEPGSMTLLGFGLVGLVGMVRRKRLA